MNLGEGEFKVTQQIVAIAAQRVAGNDGKRIK